MWKKAFVSAIRQQLSEYQEKNPRFSMRAFATKLKLSVSSLSEILRETEKWQISSERAAQIVPLLNLPKSKEQRLLALMGHPPEALAVPKKIKPEYLQDWKVQAIIFARALSKDSESFQRWCKSLGLSHLVDQLKLDLELEDGELPCWLESVLPAKQNERKKVLMDLVANITKHLESQSADLNLHTVTFIGNKKTHALIQQELANCLRRIAAMAQDGEEDAVVVRLHALQYKLTPN